MRPCRITLRALEPIDTREFSDKNGLIRLRKLVKKRMAEALLDIRSGADHA